MEGGRVREFACAEIGLSWSSQLCLGVEADVTGAPLLALWWSFWTDHDVRDGVVGTEYSI